ncbi:MAG: AAA family ATPase [Oscillospiraceae bacterium]|nr:AAA family ATPase [Oscillospiraceae bacterium]
MGKIIAVTNQKGGVGKTTTCINLVCALTQAGKRVLLCDTDPQGNATSGMGIDKNTASPNVYDVLIGRAEAEAAIVKTKFGYVLPSNRDLAGAGVELVNVEQREYRLRQALAPLRSQFDFIFIDCPPSLEMLTLNALCAAEGIIVPIQCEYFALEGVGDLVNTLRLIKKNLNPDLEVEGVLLTMYNGRTNLSLQVAAEVKKFFSGKVYHTVVPRTIRLSEAPSHGKPVLLYDPGNKGSAAYRALAKEVIAQNSATKGRG